jgi:NAD(P)-dependent dehydrogenase (short-subunit alcohol dehydrogenase family)
MNSPALDLIKQMAVPPDAFTRRTALITGGARGVGEATAHLLSRPGADVIIADILPQGQKVADAIESEGGRASFIHCDLARPELANAIFEYLEIFHNRQRRHSALGMLTPAEYENSQLHVVA